MVASVVPVTPIPVRRALISSISEFPEKLPDSRYLYVPMAHMRALHPDSPLVRGIRGSGKSVWWTVLLNTGSIELLHTLFGLHHVKTMLVQPGFGESADPRYPDRDTLETLLKSHSSRLIWRTVVLWQVAAGALPSLSTWGKRVSWLTQNPEQVAQTFYNVDRALSQSGQLCIVVFDALDRTAGTWDDRGRLLDGLLENLLEFSGYASIRLKAFVRTDMLIGPEIGKFPDASKILGKAVDLHWPRSDLYGLLWQYLANAPDGGEEFRHACKSVHGFDFSWNESVRVWRINSDFNRTEKLQWNLMDSIAGSWMGNDKRRGYPYTWLPNHLADAHDSASPRSFLAALRQAALDTNTRYPAHEYALHYEAIKRGVQLASQIRVNEMREDFPWIGEVMEPLRGLTVPADVSEIAQRWQAAHLAERLASELRGVLPRRAGSFIEGLCDQLRAAGIMAWTPDNRINLPDVYRIGFGLKRLGGVKPLRSRE